MLYEIKTMVVVAKEIKDYKVDGMPKATVIPVFNPIDLPPEAIGFE